MGLWLNRKKEKSASVSSRRGKLCGSLGRRRRKTSTANRAKTTPFDFYEGWGSGGRGESLRDCGGKRIMS